MLTRSPVMFAFLPASILILWLAAGLVPVGAQQPSGTAAPQNLEPDDRQYGEGDRIERRNDWFWSSRRAGTSSAAEASALRWAAVEQTRRAIGRQNMRRSMGFESTENFWVSMGPSPSHFGSWDIGDVSGRVAALAADWAGGVIYMGSASGGVWKTTNDGLSWTSIFDSAGTLTIGTLALDPNDPNTLWVGTGENNQGCESYFGIGLLRSTDGGVTWETRNGTGAATLDDLSSFADISIDPRDSNKLITGGRIRGCSGGSTQEGAIFTSDDAGLTWTERVGLTQVYEIQRDPAVLDIVWAATDNGVYKSEDNGVTWTLQTRRIPSGFTGRTELAIAPSDGNTVYALFQSGEFWYTDNGGGRWQKKSSGACDGQCSYNMVLRVDTVDPNTVYRGTIHIFKSTDNGRTWTDLSNNWGPSQKVHQDTHAFMMDPNNPGTMWVGSDGGVWKTTDGGLTFVNRNGNLNLTQFYAVGVHPTDPDVMCGGAQDNSSLARTGASNVWEMQAVTGDGFVCQFNTIDPNYTYITSYPSGGYPNVWRSTSGVLGGWSDISGLGSGIIQYDRINWVTPYTLDPTSPNILYLGTHRVYRSDDHGTSWAQVGPADLTAGSGSLRVVEVNRGFPSVVYSGSSSGQVWRSADGGTNWVDITAGLPGRSITDIAGDPQDPDRALATVGGFNTAHLWEWTPTGGWTAVGTGMPNVPANTVLMRSSVDVFVGNDTGVLRSVDGGETVAPYMNGMPQGMVVTDLRYNETLDVLTAGTYGRGVWQVTAGPATPDVVFDSVELPLVEVDGDGDLDVEPGETWDVRPLLRNRGGMPALAVQARLSTSTPGVTMVQPDLLGVGDMGAGVVVGPAEHYRFIADPTFPCGSDIVFDILDIASSNPPNNYADELAAFSVTVASGCQVTHWPGSVPADVQLDLLAGGDVQVSWSTACNTGELPGQSYSVQAGDLDQLHATGTYSHVPVAGECGLASPAVFAPASANEYYLVVPNEGGREGGSGEGSVPQARPQVVNTCGERRIAGCP